MNHIWFTFKISAGQNELGMISVSSEIQQNSAVIGVTRNWAR